MHDAELHTFGTPAARLVDLHVLNADEIFDSIGPPDIVEILEPLEVAFKESKENWLGKPEIYWPPLKLLSAWYKQQAQKSTRDKARTYTHKANRYEKGLVPADCKGYEQSLKQRNGKIADVTNNQPQALPLIPRHS